VTNIGKKKKTEDHAVNPEVIIGYNRRIGAFTKWINSWLP
jgi:hypothetical protein